MIWIDVAMIVFSCVMIIHMGLVDAILDAFCVEDKEIPVITCPRCLSFWSVLVFLILTRHNVILSVAASFLASYCAIWYDLFLGQMDVLYENIYKRINECSKADDTAVHDKKNRKRKSKDSSLSKV